MEWLNKNTNPSDRVTSWWDYGHWINYLADRKAVIGNTQQSGGMIGRVAYDFILGSPQNLTDSMNYFGSQYVIMDDELIGGLNGQPFGDKYGALNYLGCVHGGQTTMEQNPGTSACEFDHSPEEILVPAAQTPSTTCTISQSQQSIGIVAYTVGQNGADTTTPTYCIGYVTLATGQKISATYYYNETDANGNLVLSKGFMRQISQNAQYTVFEMVYTNDPVWPGPNGTWVGGMEDAKTDFYRSNLYSGVILGELPGYDLVFQSSAGDVKIYKMQDFTGNPTGWIDPVESKMQN